MLGAGTDDEQVESLAWSGALRKNRDLQGDLLTHSLLRRREKTAQRANALNAGVANLYHFASNGSLVFDGEYHDSYSVAVTP